ncbi:choice-of-anchor J domain-containing protein [Flavobacterium sp. J372]|uniref:choice-of-anchor J domain-containing protein n=1 Tax=Flavobacterium sp. J372 TaxID=2898436 RepID=UPI002150DC29|nr:choice-of-anchor J domain-containing protein [Flavobacterium sp. J372]MCR5860672.1 choice-of-anchor J domain-containing protein [Flavobacterium sp. J372]
MHSFPLENFRYDGDALPTGWMAYQNDVGTDVTWGLSPQASNATPGREYPAIADDQAAYLNRGNVESGNPEDWLVTKKFTVPANAELRFWTRLVQATENGSIFDVRISNANVNPDGSNLAAYTSLIDSDGWTETELAGVGAQQLLYKEKVLSLSGFAGQEVYIAFWMKAPTTNSDRWLIDDVRALSKCLPVLNPTATAPTLTTANLSWNPNGSTQWEIEIIEQAAAPVGSGVLYSGPLPYQPVLEPGKCYKYYVRAVCGPDNPSAWSNPVSFVQ